MTLSADVDIAADKDLWGKVTSDLQSEIEIADGAISGTLNYIADYSSAFGGELASGNYLALHFTATEGATITVKLTNEVTLDDDGIIVLRIADKDEQTITATATMPNGNVATVTYDLSGLTLESEGD